MRDQIREWISIIGWACAGATILVLLMLALANGLGGNWRL